jgi:MYXO-CTERM domain-containing protein
VRVVVLALLLVPCLARADTYYVAVDGSDDAAGSQSAPFASLKRAQQAVKPGDTVLLRGGRYVFSGSTAGSEVGVLLDKSGREGARIVYAAYPGETPVFDFNALRPQARIKGFSVTGSWLHLRGLELTGVQQILTNTNESWCIRVEGGASHDIFEQLDLHHNEGPGLFIADGGDNLVLNVDSHHNFDPDRNGENADGFGCHSNDAGNTFRGCRAWFNSDDGFDFINAPGVCTAEFSWAFHNGFRPDTSTGAGNGAGFKGGGFTVAMPPRLIPRHVLRFNVSWANRSQGFYANHHEGGLDFVQNTAFDNTRNFDLLADEGAARHYLRNNIAAGQGTALANATASEIDAAFNSWNSPLTVSDRDFVSVSDQGADAPRGSDGSLPALPFLHLAPGSGLIDKGEALSFPFNGSAPDLGAYETGDALDAGTPSDTGAPEPSADGSAAALDDARISPQSDAVARDAAARDARDAEAGTAAPEDAATRPAAEGEPVQPARSGGCSTAPDGRPSLLALSLLALALRRRRPLQGQTPTS